jgi:hypothetical protein
MYGVFEEHGAVFEVILFNRIFIAWDPGIDPGSLKSELLKEKILI